MAAPRPHRIRSRAAGLLAAFALAGTIASSAGARAAAPVALELVLAVDCSSSVSAEEFALQMDGIARAFRAAPVVAAIRAAGPEGIAVTLVQWAGGRTHLQAVGWTLLDRPEASFGFADLVATAPRLLEGGATAIGDAMEYAAALIESNRFDGLRRVIDISGDGIANQGQSPAQARTRLIKLGLTVNGLAILNEEPRLDRYYLAGVVGGPGAFMLTATDYGDFAAAILQKLIREIGGPNLAGPRASRRFAAGASAP